MSSTAKALSPQIMVQSLQAEAKLNPVFNTVMHAFAIRERTRAQVTVSNLRLSMAQEGYQFDRPQCEKVLQFLASIGVGRLQKHANGILYALKDIKITLQSIGRAAIGATDKLAKFDQGNSFSRLPAQITQAKAVAPIKPGHVTAKAAKATFVERRAPAAKYEASIYVKINGQMSKFDIPGGLTTDELGRMLIDMHLMNSETANAAAVLPGPKSTLDQ